MLSSSSPTRTVLSARGNIPSKPSLVIKSRLQAEAVLAEVRRYATDLAQAKAQRDGLVLEHQAKLNIPEELQAEIAALELTLAEAELGLRVWAESNREVEFGEQQSLELEPGFLRFRKGKRAISLIDGWTWPRVLQAMKRGWKKYVRMSPEVDKQGILLATSSKPDGTGKAKAPKLDPKRLKEIGLAVVQEESFAVELKPLVAVATLAPCG